MVSVCFYTCPQSCVSAASTATLYDACFCRSPEKNLKGYIVLQIENNKTSLLWPVSRGYQADSVPGCHVTRWPISTEVVCSNEPWGNKGSLITTPKPSCRPQPAPQMSHWQPSHSWGHRHKKLQPTQLSLFSTICERSVKNKRCSFKIFFFSHCCLYYSTRMNTLNLSFLTKGLLRELQTGREIYKAQVPVFFLHGCSCSVLHFRCMP